jgi:diguanylate cyclase (GGDEF)-like protein
MGIRSRYENINELQRNTLLTAIAFSALTFLLFICIYGVSNATALVILAGAGVVGFVSIITTSYWRFAVLVAVIGALALELIVRDEGTVLFMFSVLARFTVTGLLITFFASLLTDLAHNIYLDMQRLASERQAAAAKLSRWLERGNALLAVMSAISSENRLHDIFTIGLEEARKIFNADSGLIYSVDTDTGHMSITDSFGYDPEILGKMKRKWETRGDISSCLACQRMQAVTVEDLSTDDKCENLSSVGSGSSICLPITDGEVLRGVLHLRRAEPASFSYEDLQLAQAIAYQFGLAMQRSALFEQVNLLAVTDPLTGLFNYRQLCRDMEREILRSRRYEHSFSFIMADVDGFKQVNDVHGHLAGDAVLRAVARVLEEGSREVDRVYRYAGDEFAILLPETDWQDALELMEKLRAEVESLDIVPPGQTGGLHVTLSAGVSWFARDDLEMRDMVAAADRALYSAKEDGRNRAVAHPY